MEERREFCGKIIYYRWKYSTFQGKKTLYREEAGMDKIHPINRQCHKYCFTVLLG